MKKILFIAMFLPAFALTAQDCEVTVENLKGKYEGSCSKGKADGNGTATGTDSYTGLFKKGAPNGVGKYTWKHGDWYSGNWKDGLMDGQGELHLVRDDKTDSAVSRGFWKKGKYVGEYEKPYVVHNMSSGINHVKLSQMKKASNDEITIVIENTSSAGTSTTTQNKFALTEVQIVKGFFQTKYSNENSGNRNYYTLRMVTFPFRVILRMGSESVELEMFEKSDWNIQLSILK